MQKVLSPNKHGAFTEPIRRMHGVRSVELSFIFLLAIFALRGRKEENTL